MDANVNAPYGSNTEGTIVVNASDQYGHAADYSNYGKINTELFAPGDKILSTKPGTILQKEKYGIMSGTSMAAPNVTGAYALLKAYYGNSADMSEIRARLAGEDPGKLAYGFHRALADEILAACEEAERQTGIRKVALSGGVFQNRLLLELVDDGLTEMGFKVLKHSLIPPNDGGIALGQAVYGMAYVQRHR